MIKTPLCRGGASHSVWPYCSEGSRNEFRLTNRGGRHFPPVQTPENTGTIVVIAIKTECAVPSGVLWVCDSVVQENAVESWIGEEVVPGEVYGKGVSLLSAPARLEKTLASFIRPEWLQVFPSGKAIFNAVVGAIPFRENLSDDAILIKRRKLKLSLFPLIQRGKRRFHGVFLLATSPSSLQTHHGNVSKGHMEVSALCVATSVLHLSAL